MNSVEDGDLYVDDALHYYLSVEKKLLVTQPHEDHIKNNGEWWWKGEQPEGIKIDSFYNEC